MSNLDMMMMPWEKDTAAIAANSWLRKSATGKILARLTFDRYRKTWTIMAHGWSFDVGMLRSAKLRADQRLQILGYQDIPPNMMALL